MAIQLAGEDDKPLPGVAYRILLTDGSARDGGLNAQGSARIDGIGPGTCMVTFLSWIRTPGKASEASIGGERTAGRHRGMNSYCRRRRVEPTWAPGIIREPSGRMVCQTRRETACLKSQPKKSGARRSAVVVVPRSSCWLTSEPGTRDWGPYRHSCGPCTRRNRGRGR